MKNLPEQQHIEIHEKPSSLLPNQPEIPPHNELMDDLYGVGANKAVGYLPVKVMRRLGENPAAVVRLSNERGLSAYWRDPLPGDPHESKYGSDDQGDLYVFDELALGDLLQRNAPILGKRGWPSKPSDFVARVAVDRVDQKLQPDLYRLIAETFNDQRPEFTEPPKGRLAGFLGRLTTRFTGYI